MPSLYLLTSMVGWHLNHGEMQMIKQYSRLAAAAFAVLVVSGCVSQPKPVERMPFPVNEYAALSKAGSGVVDGQLFFKTVGGDVKYGAGSLVSLNPITTYSEQWFDAAHVRHAPITAGDPRQDAYIRTVQADGGGNFHFSNVPPGKYFVSGVVMWQAPTQFGLSNQGGRLTNRVDVKDGETTRIILTP
jgi:hypothetical protein